MYQTVPLLRALENVSLTQRARYQYPQCIALSLLHNNNDPVLRARSTERGQKQRNSTLYSRISRKCCLIHEISSTNCSSLVFYVLSLRISL